MDAMTWRGHVSVKISRFQRTKPTFQFFIRWQQLRGHQGCDLIGWFGLLSTNHSDNISNIQLNVNLKHADGIFFVTWVFLNKTVAEIDENNSIISCDSVATWCGALHICLRRKRVLVQSWEKTQIPQGGLQPVLNICQIKHEELPAVVTPYTRDKDTESHMILISVKAPVMLNCKWQFSTVLF